MRGLGRLSGYQRLGLVMLVGLLALIALGGTVRVTDSGLACPDWPLCNGALIPGGDYRVWIEWTHRLVASLVGVVIVAFVVGAILRHRQRRWVVAPAVAGVVALGVQVVLGGLTVTEELAAGLVSAHLATALIIVVLLLTAWLATFVPAGGAAPGRARGGAERQLAELCVVAAVGLFAVMVLGSYVSGTEAGFFCAGDWPLCNGSLLPEGRLPGLQVAHRYLVAFEGLLIAGIWLLAWRLRGRARWVLRPASLVAALYGAQILFGAALMWTTLADWSRVLHLFTAAVTWAALVALAAAAVYRVGGLPLLRAGAGASTPSWLPLRGSGSSD